MVVLSRLPVLAIVASLLVAVPATAEEPPAEGSPEGEPTCGDGSSGNCTSEPPPHGNSTPPSGGSGGGNSTPPAGGGNGGSGNSTSPPDPTPGSQFTARATCDLVRPTGGQPSVSINPILGVLTVDPRCITRHVHRAGEGAVHFPNL